MHKTIFIKFSIASLFVTLQHLSFCQNIYTYAGIGGTGGFSGDGGQAILAQLWNPLGIVADGSGNVYFSDSQNGRIRFINPSGIINTFAGGGVITGDGGPANMAIINNPHKIAFDSFGNMYIAEYANNRVRKINTLGVINTVAGDGSVIGGFSGDGGLATLAKLNGPSAVAVDALGNLYIADRSNNRIRMVNSSGTITTIAGTGGNSYSGDGGLATLAQLNSPLDVEVDPAGNVLIADYANRCIRKISSSTITTIAGTGTQGNSGDGAPATSAQIGVASAITIDFMGNLYIADGLYGTIRKVNTLGIISTIAGTGTQGYSGDGGPALLAKIYPNDIAIDASNNIYIAEAFNQRVRLICNSSCIMNVSENNLLTELKTYPNPVSDFINISGNKNEFEYIEIEISNYLGQTILTTEFKNQIDVSKLTNGFYTLKIITKDNQHHRTKFLKE